MTSSPILCRACGRGIDRVDARRRGRTYCSRRCREHRVSPLDRRLESALLEMLAARAPGASLCPSEVARAVGAERWRELLEPVRRAGRRLAASGAVEFRQRGRVVDACTSRGPVRIRRSNS